jgi:hypothetical protein
LLRELPPQVTLMVKTATTTGMRISEVLELRWVASIWTAALFESTSGCIGAI